MEIWKDIKGYEGIYQVSNLGRVKRFKEYFMQSHPNKKGYHRIRLSKNGNCKTVSLARLVAEAFIPNPDQLPEVNHKDEDKNNNTCFNLEWCDRKYNVNYGHRTEKQKETYKSHSSNWNKIIQFTMDGKIIKVWDSINDIEASNFTKSNVYACCKFSRESSGGYKWLYYKDYINGAEPPKYKKRNQFCCKKVVQLTLDGSFVKLWESASEAGQNGYNPTSISACCRGREKTHKNYKWKFYE